MRAQTYTIARRAFSQYAVVETLVGTWVEANLRCMELQAERRDGEYFEFGEGETVGPRPVPTSSYQSGFDYL